MTRLPVSVEVNEDETGFTIFHATPNRCHEQCGRNQTNSEHFNGGRLFQYATVRLGPKVNDGKPHGNVSHRLV